MHFILRIIVVGVVVFFLPYIMPGISIESAKVAFIVGIVLALVNTLIKPFISLLTLPLNILTLGLFGLVVNGFLFWVVARFVSGFSIDSFLYALAGAFIVSLANWFVSKV